MRHAPLVCGIVLLGSFAGALAIRSVVNFHQVFQADGVHFQDPDAWFHMRTVWNLMHHYPHRSGFDPYSGFPTGQPINTGPFDDLAIGTLAWLIGLGSPSAWLVDTVGAWFPAVLGSLITIPVFLLGRELFHPIAGLSASLLIAIAPGNFLAVSRLGNPDHHVLESFFSTVVLLMMVMAIQRHRPLRYGLPAGVVLGCFLATRPAGGFLVVLIASWAVLQCLLDHARDRSSLGTWLLVTPMLFVAWLLFLPASGLKWSNFATLELWIGIAAVSLAAGVSGFLRRRGSARWVYFVLPPLAVTLGLGLVLAFRHQEIYDLLQNARRYAGGARENTVLELRPLLTFTGALSLNPVLAQFGTIWLAALAGLVLFARNAFSKAACTLVLAWTALMIAGTLIQNRMGYYASVCLCLLAGYAIWLILRGAGRIQRVFLSIAFLALIAEPSFTYAMATVAHTDDQTADWTRTLGWLRTSTPEPMGDPAAFYRYYSALQPSEAFHYPPSAYGILSWWDFGHWITAVAHRIPVANGMQSGAEMAARFFLANDEAEAEKIITQTGTRFVVADNSLPQGSGDDPSSFPAIVVWAGRRTDEFTQIYLRQAPDGASEPVIVYYPAYYRTMLARLYLFEGKGTQPEASTSVIWYADDGGGFRRILSVRGFDTYDAARRFADTHRGEKLVLGDFSNARSCVPVEPLTRYRLVYRSNGKLFSTLDPITTVKVFEHLGS